MYNNIIVNHDNIHSLTRYEVYIMQEKEKLKARILEFKPYINLSAVLDELGISRNSFYLFINKGVNSLSLQSLQKIVDFVENL